MLRKVGGRYMIVDSSGKDGGVVDCANVYTLNATAAFIWQAMAEREFCVEDAVEVLCAEFDVERDRALQDVSLQLAEWKQYGLIED